LAFGRTEDERRDYISKNLNNEKVQQRLKQDYDNYLKHKEKDSESSTHSNKKLAIKLSGVISKFEDSNSDKISSKKLRKTTNGKSLKVGNLNLKSTMEDEDKREDQKDILQMIMDV